MTGRHTPTPWTFAKRALRIYGGRTRDFVVAHIPVSPDYEANAELIVRAVNSHDELVEALETAFDFLGGVDGAAEVRQVLLTALSHARSTDGEQP